MKIESKIPVIGIVGKFWNEEPIWKTNTISQYLVDIITENGGIPIGIPLHRNTYCDDISRDFEIDNGIDIDDAKKIDKILDRLDGVILQGGLVSSYQEVYIAKKCIECDVPLLGICAGFNNIARAMHIPLYDVYDHYGIINAYNADYHNHEDIRYRHKIEVNKYTILYDIVQCKSMSVNSIHRMYMPYSTALLPQSIRISSICPYDNSVESFELRKNRFVVAVKWHPELMKTNPYSKKLFKRFIEECKDDEGGFLANGSMHRLQKVYYEKDEMYPYQ